MKMKNKEIAARIDAHLKRFEADKEINNYSEVIKLTPYYGAGSWAVGRYIGVRYVRFQAHSNLTNLEATIYLGWLDAGNVGKHYKSVDQWKRQAAAHIEN